MPGSNIGRTSDSPSKPGQCFRCNSMNSVAIRIASAFESVFRIAQPPMTSLVSENGPSVTVILPLASRTRTPSLLGSRPPVSTSVPFLNDSSTNMPIASIKAGGGADSRYDSEWRMNVRYFMAPPWGFRSSDERASAGSTCRKLFFCRWMWGPGSRRLRGTPVQSVSSDHAAHLVAGIDEHFGRTAGQRRFTEILWRLQLKRAARGQGRQEGGEKHDGHHQAPPSGRPKMPVLALDGQGVVPAALPEPAQAAQKGKRAPITSAVDSLPQHRANRRRLPARQLRLREVLRQQSCLPRVLFRFLADAEPHPQLTHLELSDEAVRGQPHAFPELFHRVLHVQVHAEGHRQKHPELGNFRMRGDALAQLFDQLSAVARLEHVGIGEHPEEQPARFLWNRNQRRGSNRWRQGAGVCRRRHDVLLPLHVHEVSVRVRFDEQ